MTENLKKTGTGKKQMLHFVRGGAGVGKNTLIRAVTQSAKINGNGNRPLPNLLPEEDCHDQWQWQSAIAIAIDHSNSSSGRRFGNRERLTVTSTVFESCLKSMSLSKSFPMSKILKGLRRCTMVRSRSESESLSSISNLLYAF